MHIENGKARELKIAYIGGGSRGWAWGLMSDLATEESLSGKVYLYDIDQEAAEKNEVIGNQPARPRGREGRLGVRRLRNAQGSAGKRGYRRHLHSAGHV